MLKLKLCAVLIAALNCGLSAAAAEPAAAIQPAYTQGNDYRQLAPERQKTAVNEVSEFFSFWCYHCKAFNAQMRDIAAELDGTVPVKLYPVDFGDAGSHAAQIGYFYALKHGKGQKYLDVMFALIHEGRVDIKNPEQIASVINLIDLDGMDFLKHRNDAEFTTESAKVEDLLTRYDINAVPELVVNGKYIPQIFKYESTEDKVGLLRYLSTMP